jgi:predicted DNA-binding protein
MRRTTLNLTTQQYKRLVALVEETGISKSEHLRRALDEYLNREQERRQKQQR